MSSPLENNAQNTSAPAAKPVAPKNGFEDFGAGTVSHFKSACLRNAEIPTNCTLCVDGCPVQAISFEQIDDRERFEANNLCLACGACVELCPTAAISMTRLTIQELNRRLLDACFKTSHIVLTCARTEALANAAADDDTSTAAAVDTSAATAADNNPAYDLKLIELAQEKKLLYTVPCFGFMGSEIWFSILTEIHSGTIKKLDIYLPLGQCEQCPVNAMSNIENMFEEAIGLSEQWTELQVGFLPDLCDLKLTPGAVLAPLLKGTDEEVEYDRREAFTGMFKGFRTAWDAAAIAAEEAAAPQLTPVEIAAAKRNRLNAYQNTILGHRASTLKTAPTQLSSSQPQPLSSKPNVTRVPSRRFMLIEALGRNSSHAAAVALKVSSTNFERCVGCGDCVKVCALGARVLEKWAKEEAGTDTFKAISDPAICLACDACLFACKQKACFYTTISGTSFLVD
ncbi:MAG: 4Fe-4S dicluster domain-containing protein [Coriobacteriia bacterium]|jgi:ferredoxin|nr:4Fe-4S dicluster domain-containing protein [Coriobacteriia bacterium]MDR2713967.1 4Fe-4S dicluster domain-containing protein [Coriobacteriales bacterium]